MMLQNVSVEETVRQLEFVLVVQHQNEHSVSNVS